MGIYRHPEQQDPVFKRVIPFYQFNEGLTVFWEFKPTAPVVEPFTCQVEYNHQFNDPDSWVDIGNPVTNQLYAQAITEPLTGKIIKAGIRVRLTDAANRTYTSFSVPITGAIPTRQWLIYKTLYRRHNLHARSLSALPGILLKRKTFGAECHCRDPYTQELTDTYCTDCYGTGFIGGYWKAWEGRLIDISPRVEITRRDPQLVRGVVDSQLVSAMIFSPVPVATEDVWIRLDNDIRYNIRQVRNRAEIAGVPLSQLIEMGPFEFSSAIYAFPVT